VSPFLDSTPRPLEEWIKEPRLEQEQHLHTLKPAPEVDAIIERKSEKDAEAAIQGFIHKMTVKLYGILDQKGDFVSVTVTGGLCDNTMVFSFTDGSCFTVTNDIILNRSIYNTLFNQYPTRFTDVTLRGTKCLKGISEAWMKKNFKA
jgi:hypothetical protein